MSPTAAPAGPRSEINVTPLVDVVLVLLIIFMVVTPLVQRGYTIEVPRGGGGPPAPAIVLAIDSEGCPLLDAGACRVRIGGEAIELDALAARAASLFEHRAGGDRVLFVSAEDSLNYEGVLRIVDVARSGAGTDVRVAIAADEALAPHGAGAATVPTSPRRRI
jgi:biopolymer transport protein ExbD